MTQPRNVGLETPEADAAEQWTDVVPDDDDRAPNPPGVETPEWDAQEQNEVVQDEDEYR
ncbi:hypothetical protein [Paractinoplanes brasiliensis]|uniref:Uncharacterized protein n=1 Tax=Paractinoplanes brasiliensis TaxID=52695 RepID=A0A4R6JRZ3_9ACTN|nr:hypothetical protein [Actinoplanes brasiliensis]TDO39364.1 hypothetical protein C8E87_3049 [Actinoplanes brasiliensis]GID32616.1 hypothetical protein Abr02nite_75990 [Actinoplanes brasiliensis]